MTLSRNEYEAHQDKIIADLAELKAKGNRIIAADVVVGLVPTEDNSHVRKYAKKELGVSTADFDREMRKLRITEKAGDEMRFPTKPDGYSNRKPDTNSDLKPDSVPI